jgi:SPOR domain
MSRTPSASEKASPALGADMGKLALFKATLGGLGGLAAICVKYIGQDHNVVMDWIDTGDPRLHKLLIGYLILTPILIFLGGLVTWVSDETNHLKLLAMGVAAPALITTWAGGATPGSASPHGNEPGHAYFFKMAPVAPAHANEQSIQIAQADTIKQGLELFFGVGKIEPRYWVIVGSHREKGDAEAQAAAINVERPTLHAFVGKRQPGNDDYPVIIGEYVNLAEANRLREVARELSAVKDSHLSAYADRRP